MSSSDAALVEDAVLGRSAARPLAERDAALAAFVRKLTRTPAEMSEADVAAFRSSGYTDREIFDVTAITAFFAYVNRIALGLGVPLEKDWHGLLER